MQLVEGSGRAKLSHVIKSLGFNQDTTVELATVTAALPDVKIKVDNVSIEFDADDLIVCEHLTEHEREASINGGPDAVITFKPALLVGDRVIVASINNGQRYVVLDRLGKIGGE